MKKNEEKKKSYNWKPWALGLAGVAVVGAFLNKISQQNKIISQQQGIIKNQNDVITGLMKTIKEQAFGLGKNRNRV